MNLAEEFLRVFAGNQRAHGEYTITTQVGAKAKGRALTVGKPPSEELWRKHLDGKKGLGIVPIMEDATCVWGAVDVDEYEGLDLEDISCKLPEPLVMCRSKSGGMHIYLFTQVPVTAALMRKKLAMVARAVGHPNAEIFPKQDQMNDGDIGNWINSPYFDNETTNRYCLKNGIALSAEEFITLVGENSLNMQQLVGLQIDMIQDENTDEFADAPPCIQNLVKNGFPPGSRNAALFSMGVYARMKFATGWEDKVFDYNQRFMGPGTYSEVAGILRSLRNKTYVYKCKDQPLLSQCNKEQCTLCEFGIKPTADDEKARRPSILDEVEQPVICYAPEPTSKDEPYWVFNIKGASLDVTVDMARVQNVFCREYLRQYHRVILPIKDSKWARQMNEILESAEILQLAPDAGIEGQMMILVEEFCTGRTQAKTRDELLLGKPWTEDGRTYLRSGDLARFFDQQRFRAVKEKDIYPILKRHGAAHHKFNILGKCVSCWSVKAFTMQTEEFEREDMPDEAQY